MTGWLLDTNVLSEVVRKNADSRVLERLRVVPRDETFTSVIGVMELRHGAARHPQGDRLWARLLGEVLTRVRLVPFGGPDAVAAGMILAELARRGEPIGVEDVMIAATALARDLTVVTRNTRPLRRVTGLRVESWWE